MKQKEIKNHIEAIFKEEIFFTLATSYSDQPWSCALEFIHDGTFNIYWRSNNGSLHGNNIQKNNKVAGSISKIVNSNKESAGVQFSGTIVLVPKIKYRTLTKKIEVKRNKVISQMIQKEEDSRIWYQLKIDKCYFLHEPLLGYERLEYLI
jgi:uncharacterized protein YhbP (UPF0306 family)